MRNIRRLNSHADICDLLARSAHPRTGTSIFPTYRDLACFAALLGFEQGKLMKLDGPTDLLVDGRIMANSDLAADLVYLLGLAATRGQDILRDDGDYPEALATLFEEYVAGGLQILKDWVRAEPSDPHGDRAVLTALKKGGYLDDAPSGEDAIDRVVF